MRRVSENQSVRSLVVNALENKRRLNDLSNQLTSGLKVNKPSDSVDAGSIARYQTLVSRVDSYSTAISQAKSFIEYQDGVVAQATEIVLRAKEIAQQGANETLNPVSRTQLAEEVFQLREQMIGLANSTYQGRYVYGGTDDDDAPYDASTYTAPASGPAQTRYVFDAEAGTDTAKSIRITDEIAVTLTTPANEVFGTGIEALERLSRALAGYQTNPLPSGTPDGTGNAYVFPDEYHLQTEHIRGAIDLLNHARDQELIPERVTVGGRLRRLETGQALLDLTKNSAKEVLSRLQDADETEVAANLQQAQTALQASYSVTAKVLRMTILDYV
ncbi:MAG: flagellin [Pseudomonadota bacterium]|jgi:flagellar hook-associated protein 3 FlgL